MKVIDLQPYRARKEIKRLEERVGQLALQSSVGSAKEMKMCFKEWLKRSNR
jgi:hypothetical protein